MLFQGLQAADAALINATIWLIGPTTPKQDAWTWNFPQLILASYGALAVATALVGAVLQLKHLCQKFFHHNPHTD